jgi:hypothetical protein
MAGDIQSLQAGINDRQQELQGVTDILARTARQLSIRAMASKVILVLLGALVATRETAAQLLGNSNAGASIFYALLGTAVAVVAGLEAAFKWETRGAELTALAARCQAAIRSVDSQWHRQVGSATGDEQTAGALTLLEMQDARLAEAQERAATLGVNVTIEVRELQRDSPTYMA